MSISFGTAVLQWVSGIRIVSNVQFMAITAASAKSDSERLRQLEDVVAIGNLKAAYCAACDDDHNGARVVELFVPEGVWETSINGKHPGHAAIQAFFNSVRSSGRMSYSTHMVTNQVVHVDGDTATGSWSFTMMYTSPDDERYRIIGFYRDTFVRTAEGWLFASLFSDVQDYVLLEASSVKR